MRNEISITRPETPTTANTQAVETAVRGIARVRVLGFLDTPLRTANKLACSNCPTELFCRAVVGHMLTRSSIAPQDVPLIRASGVDVTKDGYCPTRLVQEARRRTAGNEFWIPNDDPLKLEEESIQVGEVLRDTSEAIVARINAKQRI